MLTAQEIALRFLDTRLQVHPDVVRYIQEQDEPDLINRILAQVPEDTVVVSAKHIPGMHATRDGTRFLLDPSVEVVSGSAGTSGPVNGTSDYLYYFRDRFSRLGGMIRNRMGAMPIEALTKSTRYRQEECTIIGMVVEVSTTKNGHRIAEIEDTSASMSVLFRKGTPSFPDSERIIHDEVIGVKGKLSTDGRLFFASQLYRPDIRIDNTPFRSEQPGKAVLISDVHVGSNTFLGEAWNRFADWLSDSDFQYLLIAGDLVDGIGIYPGQEQELTIKNIYEQYDVFGAMLSDLPSRMKIIVAPGNHDVVRGAEPQPVIPEVFTRKFPANCTLVENPALVNLQGVRVLMYHGRSIDDMIGLIPGASYEQSGMMMEEMLVRRHLAPAYGRRTPIAAGKTDRMIIDPLPEILHTGHVHIKGITTYRGVLGVNAGTWQSQTAFQKQMNVNP
ncbi:MAG: DNA-directed DNA polymerase II small subunit, partial [Methanoregula sp.]|nr:DNA-directed DNA polymerase II small subunit [Methanoregula sp.]